VQQRRYPEGPERLELCCRRDGQGRDLLNANRGGHVSFGDLELWQVARPGLAVFHHPTALVLFLSESFR
jgi:hypothetical protein